MRRATMLMAVACWPGVALAADEQRPRIVVSGSASVTTPPDLATIEFRIVAKRRAIDEGLAALAAAVPTASRVSIAASTGADRGDGARDIVVTARRVAAPATPPPIVVDLTPRPIETQAQVSVTYEIAS